MLVGVFGDPGVALADVDSFGKGKGGESAVVGGVCFVGAGVECNDTGIEGTGELLAVTDFVQSDKAAAAAVAVEQVGLDDDVADDNVESLGTLAIRPAAGGTGDSTKLSL